MSSTLSPIDDLTYDVLTVLQKKAKAIEAYDKYILDAESEDDDELKDLFVLMRRQDEDNIQVLKEALARRLDEDLGYEDEIDDVDELDEVEDEDDEDEYESADDVEEPAAAGSDEVAVHEGAGGSAGGVTGADSVRRGETPRHR
jgi:hypothetical protein